MSYEQHRGYHRGRDNSRDYLLKLIPPFSSVLDVGCGSGFMYENFRDAKIPIDYKGVDLTKKFIEGAKLDFPETKWEVQSAEELKEKDNSFDVVTLYHILELVPDWRKAIREALRVTRKTVIINFWHGMSDRPCYLKTAYDQSGEYDYLTEIYSNWIGKEEIEEFMVQNGFNPKPKKVFRLNPNTYHYFVLDKKKWQPKEPTQE